MSNRVPGSQMLSLEEGNNKTGKGNNKSKDGFGSVTHTNSEREESCNAKTAQLNPHRGITQLETILSMTKKNTKVLFL